MAEATEMTLTGVRSARVGEERREVRLSVTYALDKDDDRLERVTAVKMTEVERGITAAWKALGQTEPVATDRIAPEPAPALNSPDDEEYDGYFNGEEGSGEEPEEDEPINSAPTQVSSYIPPSPAEVSPAARCIPAYNAADGAGYRPPVNTAPSQTEPPVLASKVQLLAIRPLLTKLNFTSDDTRKLLQEVFQKWSLERLTRDEANDLLVSLRRGEIEAQEKRTATAPNPMNGSYPNGRHVH